MGKLNFALFSLIVAASCGDNLQPTSAGDDDNGSAVDADTSGDDGDIGDATEADGAVTDGQPQSGDGQPGDGMTPDAVGGGGVMCGNMTCGSNQVCCISLGGSSCAAAGTCTGQSVACDGPEDCTVSGETCCAALGGTSCSAVAQCLAEVCHVDGDCDQGEECCGPMTAPRVCRNVCPGPP